MQPQAKAHATAVGAAFSRPRARPSASYRTPLAASGAGLSVPQPFDGRRATRYTRGMQYTDASQVLPLLRAEMPTLKTRYGVRSLALFGSVVRGEARETSDLDILVEYEAAPTLFEFVRLKMDLSELLGAPVDLVMRSALKPTIGRAILAEMLPV